MLEEIEDDAEEGVGHETDIPSAGKFDPPSYAIANCWEEEEEEVGVEDGDAGMC